MVSVSGEVMFNVKLMVLVKVKVNVKFMCKLIQLRWWK